MAYIKYAGEEAVGRIADYVNKKLTFASSMPESPDANTIVLYVGADTSAYKQGGIYQYNGTDWNLINLVKTIELTQAEYDALPSAAKLNGTIYFVTDGNSEGSIVSGYYNTTDGKFYEESTYTTEMAANVNVLYIDLNTNTTYIYDIDNEEYIQVSGGGSGTVIKYVTTLPSTGIEDIIYGYTTENSYTEITADGFLDSNDNFVKTGNTYTAASGVLIQASADNVDYYNFGSLTYDDNNNEFILSVIGQSDITISVGDPFFFKVITKLFYAGDADNQVLSLLAGGGGGTGATYVAGTGINISSNIISGAYQAGDGINIDQATISTTDFVGTRAEWDALTATQKEAYDKIFITDDTTHLDEYPGHEIFDGTTAKVQREGLSFVGFNVTDDSTNNKTKIEEVPYTAGDGIDIINKEVSVDETRPSTFIGTVQEWEGLTTAEKAQYTLVNLTNDPVVGPQVVVDAVEDGNLNPVTSNAVYDVLQERQYVVTADGTKTYSQLLKSLYTPIKTLYDAGVTNMRICFSGGSTFIPYHFAIYDGTNFLFSSLYAARPNNTFSEYDRTFTISQDSGKSRVVIRNEDGTLNPASAQYENEVVTAGYKYILKYYWR